MTCLLGDYFSKVHDKGEDGTYISEHLGGFLNVKISGWKPNLRDCNGIYLMIPKHHLFILRIHSPLSHRRLSSSSWYSCKMSATASLNCTHTKKEYQSPEDLGEGWALTETWKDSWNQGYCQSDRKKISEIKNWNKLAKKLPHEYLSVKWKYNNSHPIDTDRRS